jgi:DNA-binding CsgD family transcriptional regulator
MDRESLFQQVVESIYEAAAEPGTWSDALDRLDRLFNANSAHLFLWDGAAKRRVAAFRSRSFSDDHSEWDYFHEMNPRRKILARLPLATPMNCADYIDDAAVSRSEFFTDYSLPARRRYLLGANVYREDAATTSIAVMRPPDEEPFNQEDKLYLARLMPHLVRVSRFDRRMRAALRDGDLSTAALDRLSDAILVVDVQGRLVRSNATARRMFESTGPLRLRSGRIRAEFMAQSSRLLALVAEAATGAVAAAKNEGAMCLGHPDGEQWLAVIAPLMPNVGIFDLSDRRFVLIVATPVRVSRSVEDRLRQAYGLTLAEARLAGRIVQGARLDEISDELQLSIATLRTQLKSVLAKTETRRQGELMQLGLRLDAVDAPSRHQDSEA